MEQLPLSGAAQNAAPDTPSDRHAPFVLIPEALIRDAIHHPRIIATYALLARQWLLTHTAIPLSAQDLCAYDPTINRAQALRALDWLCDHGWLLPQARKGTKTLYVPTWGKSDTVWDAARPRFGRSGRCPVVSLDLRLFDLYIGRLIPYAGQLAAEVRRYITIPLLTLHDIGAYIAVLRGYQRCAAPTLHTLGLVRDGQVVPLPDEATFLAWVSQLQMQAHPITSLSSAGHARAGLIKQSSTGGVTLFFVPKDMIDHMIDHPISDSISADAPQTACDSAAVSPETAVSSAHHQPETIHRKGVKIKPKNPPQEEQELSATSSLTTLPAIPDTAAAQRLRAFAIHPKSIAELADLPLDIVEQAIAQAQANDNLYTRQGAVVTALRTYRQYGYLPGQENATTPVNWAAEAAKLGDLACLSSADDEASESAVKNLDTSITEASDYSAEGTPCASDPAHAEDEQLVLRESSPTATEEASGGIQHSPGWIAADQWADLPAMLRAVLSETHWDGQNLVWPSATLQDMCMQRYAALLTELCAQARADRSTPPQEPEMIAQHASTTRIIDPSHADASAARNEAYHADSPAEHIRQHLCMCHQRKHHALIRTLAIEKQATGLRVTCQTVQDRLTVVGLFLPSLRTVAHDLQIPDTITVVTQSAMQGLLHG